MPDFINFRINHDLLREVMRIKDERSVFIPVEYRLPRVLSAKKYNANRFPISHDEWRKHLSNVSKIRNLGNLKLDLQFDYSREKPKLERKPLTETQKKRLKNMSYKPSPKVEVEIQEEVLESCAA